MTLDEIRAWFPHARDHVYLNHAATGAYSARVARALEDDIADRQGRDLNNYPRLLAKNTDTQARLARLLGTAPERVEFTASTTDALSLLAEGLDWQPGDRVALPACEFPANVYPFLALERRGVAVDFIPHRDGTFTLDDVAAALTPKTRLVTVSWVQFLSGFKVDAAALADLVHAHGALLCLDAIQGLGALRLDVKATGVDFLACGTQKWWLAPQGLGFLYATPALTERLTPRAGWLNVPVDWEDFCTFDLRFLPGAARFRMGSVNQAGLLGFGAALDQYEEAGPGWAEARVLALAARLREGADRLGHRLYGSPDPAHASGIVALHHADAQGVIDRFAAEGIVASTRNRLVRLSPTWYNTEDEIDRALAVLGRA